MFLPSPLPSGEEETTQLPLRTPLLPLLTLPLPLPTLRVPVLTLELLTAPPLRPLPVPLL